MKKISYVIIIFSISFYLTIEFIGDRLIKNRLQKNISSQLNRDVSIDKLNINYLSGEADIKGLGLLNKKFEGYLLKVDTIMVKLDAFSLFTDNIVIENILLKDININYYFNYSDQIISDNVRSLGQEIKKKSADTQSNKYFNIKNLDAKNISLSVLSPTIDIKKNFSLSDMNFKNIGNTDQSNDYKNTLKKVFNDILNKVKEKFSIEDVLENLENFNTNEIENKVKDKFKNKLKKLIN